MQPYHPAVNAVRTVWCLHNSFSSACMWFHYWITPTVPNQISRRQPNSRHTVSNNNGMYKCWSQCHEARELMNLWRLTSKPFAGAIKRLRKVVGHWLSSLNTCLITFNTQKIATKNYRSVKSHWSVIEFNPFYLRYGERFEETCLNCSQFQHFEAMHILSTTVAMVTIASGRCSNLSIEDSREHTLLTSFWAVHDLYELPS